MPRDDWRVRVELEEERHATDFLARLGLDLGSEARELAKELESHRLAVSNDADTVFVYAPTRDAPGPDIEEELLDEGYAPWEVRVECESLDAAQELAETLEGEGYGVVRR